jgi:hypothetical protein
MIIYLYKKTHLVTGLKYLGKTTSKNPHAYRGSGIYWQSHIKKHGCICSTEILRECHTNEEAKIWGIYFSELWKVVESDDWANLKPEIGDGGFVKLSESSVKKRMTTRLKRYGTLNTNTPNSIAKAIETRKRNGTLNTQTDEVVKKRQETMSKKGYKPVSEETKLKAKATKIANGTWKKSSTPSQASIDKANETKRKNGTKKRTHDSIAKQLATLKSNGGRRQTAESLEKAQETRIKNGTLLKKQCPYCGKYASASPYTRHHGDNCKKKDKS